MLGLFNFDLMDILIGVPTTLIALTFHELAHGFVSTKLGDPTPKYQGRLTLNPLAHLDLIGTILMILTGFGWAKPVQVNPRYYKNQKRGMALVALAGPLTNLLLAFFGMLIGVGAMLLCTKTGSYKALEIIGTITSVFAVRNLCFMVFNIIPLPPLDGFKVAGLVIPNRIYYQILQYEQYVIFLLMALSFAGIFDVIIGNGVSFFFGKIAEIVYTIFGLR